MANTYISEDGVTTLISLTKNELKKKASSVNSVAPDANGNVTLYGDKVALSSTDDTTIAAKIGTVQSTADTAKSISDKIKNAITSGNTALYTSTDSDNPLNGTLTPLFATKVELNDAIGGLTSIKVKVVSVLPETGVNGTIYLVNHAHGTDDVYDEYLWIESYRKFEKIGNTDIDLSSYAKKTDLNSYLTTSAASSTYATKTELGSYLKSTNAESTYAKKTDLNSYLTTATASSTYVAKADLTEITSTKVTELWNSIS